MALQIKGRIVNILNPESGVSKIGNSWTKKEFVVETEEQFPKKICFTLFGDKTPLIDGCSTGEMVEISFNIDAREFNGKWFNTISPWKIDKVTKEAGNDTNFPPPPSIDDLPPEPLYDNSSDGLPF